MFGCVAGHGERGVAEAIIGEAAAHTLCGAVRVVAVREAEEEIEGGVAGLDLRLGVEAERTEPRLQSCDAQR